MKKQENRKTADNEQIQLKVGQCNEMFIAHRKPGHEKRGCKRRVNGERGKERKRDGGGRWWKR